MGPRTTIHGIWAFLVLAILIGLAATVSRMAPGDGEDVGDYAFARPFPEVGSTARDFALPRLQTRSPWTGPDTLRLSDFRGRWVYLDVFGSWCPPCLNKYPTMVEVARELEKEGVAVLGLLLDSPPESAAAWLEENGGMAYPFAVLDGETARDWGLTGAPMGFLISPEGRIQRKCFGCSSGATDVKGLPDEIRHLQAP